jgi:Calcineurin-like phosphoesterase
MTTLVIPDIHHNIKLADAIRSRVKHDHIVYLGDYFDDFNDTHTRVANTAIWLERICRQPNTTVLLGNHDIPYAFGDSILNNCPGYSEEKSYIIKQYMATEWHRFRIYTQIGKWTLSHGGFSSYQISMMQGGIKQLEAEQRRCLHAYYTSQTHPWMYCSSRRDGRATCHDGPLWCDWSALDVVKGLNQLVGHTRDHVPRNRCNIYGNENVCIDTNLANYALIHDGDELAVHSTNELGT